MGSTSATKSDAELKLEAIYLFPTSLPARKDIAVPLGLEDLQRHLPVPASPSARNRSTDFISEDDPLLTTFRLLSRETNLPSVVY
jgi:hypothetical protein